MNARSNERSLTLHVGLPKTGTTTLQREILPEFDGFVCSTESSGESACLARQLEDLYYTGGRYPDYQTEAWKTEINRWWTTVRTAYNAPKLVSLERLFRWHDHKTSAVWPFMGEGSEARSQRAGKHPLVGFLEAMSHSLEEVQLRVVVTIRNQADFMASLYAQISKSLVSPSQADFESKVLDLLATDDPFFDWSRTLSQISETVGPEKLKVLVFETGLNCLAEDLASFLELEWSCTHPIGHLKKKGSCGVWRLEAHGHRTSRKILRGIWPIDVAPRARSRITPFVAHIVGRTLGQEKAFHQILHMTDDLRNKILVHYARTNACLQTFTPYDLGELGYFGN